MNFDKDLFIKEISERSTIWDEGNLSYYNKPLKEKAWQELCMIFFSNFKEMSPEEQCKSVRTLKRRWKALRCAFNKELVIMKKIDNDSRYKSRLQRKPFIYFEQLSFLFPIAEAKLMQKVSNDNNQVDIEEDDVIDGCLKRKKIKLEEDVDLFIKMEEKLSQEPEVHYLISLLPHLKKVPQNLKLDIQVEIIEILKKYIGKNNTEERISNGSTPKSSEFEHNPVL